MNCEVCKTAEAIEPLFNSLNDQEPLLCHACYRRALLWAATVAKNLEEAPILVDEPISVDKVEMQHDLERSRRSGRWLSEPKEQK
jgi:hypothetical protein